MFRSNYQIPERFLREAGVPEKLLGLSSLRQTVESLYYSCFSSYSNWDISGGIFDCFLIP